LASGSFFKEQEEEGNNRICFIFINSSCQIAASLAVSAYSAEAYAEAAVFDTTNFSPDTKRQLSKVGSKSLSEEEMRNLSSIISEMGSIYGQASINLGLSAAM